MYGRKKVKKEIKIASYIIIGSVILSILGSLFLLVSAHRFELPGDVPESYSESIRNRLVSSAGISFLFSIIIGSVHLYFVYKMWQGKFWALFIISLFFLVSCSYNFILFSIDGSLLRLIDALIQLAVVVGLFYALVSS